jgi:hypothetical protein
LWNGIVFGEPTEELAAGVFIEDRVEELVGAVDDIDHQLFHFLIIEAETRGHGIEPNGLVTVTSA